MDIDIEFENICLNCKEKGYYFGYSFKTIRYRGETILDMPTQHLNRPAIAFVYHHLPLYIHSMEISHPIGSVAEKPVFAMINMKRGQTLQKFTYQYKMQNNKKFYQPPEKLLVSVSCLGFICRYLHVCNQTISDDVFWLSKFHR